MRRQMHRSFAALAAALAFMLVPWRRKRTRRRFLHNGDAVVLVAAGVDEAAAERLDG